MLHCIVTGSHKLTAEEREWAERAIANRLNQFNSDTVLYEGAAWGVDTIANSVAKRREFYQIRTFPARWHKFSLGAGSRRNGSMLNEMLTYKGAGEQLVLAFLPKGHWSPGTKDMVSRALKSGVRVEVWTRQNANGSLILSEIAGDSRKEWDSAQLMLLTTY